MFDITEWVASSVFRDSDGIWSSSDRREFAYSDGAGPETYIASVVRNAKDLTSKSAELENSIIDWASEYHLSRNRAQLLSGFDFSGYGNALEVGCGCGAMSRILGEQFENVISIEGSRSRARIARSRTRDLGNVEIINSPFQEIEFKRKFDVIFCIGVFEYSQMFVGGDSPYERILSLFRDYLTETGLLVLAIENQFGLKYFQGSREDHTAVPFDGIEGYRRYSNKARTFGYEELSRLLAESFEEVRFFYPYPDYKIPEGVLSEELLRVPGISELLGGYAARDYPNGVVRQFDERLALRELEKNKQLHFFANSFLVIAARGSVDENIFPQLGIHYSSSRVSQFQTETRFVQGEDGSISVLKTRVADDGNHPARRVEHKQVKSEWHQGESIGSEVLLRSLDTGLSLKEVFSPAVSWVRFLTDEGQDSDGEVTVPGHYLDCLWKNCYRNGEDVEVIDQEWVWPERIPLRVIVIRAIYSSVCEIQEISGIQHGLTDSRRRRLIVEIGRAIGITLTKSDFERFIDLECEFMEAVFDIPRSKFEPRLRLSLRSRRALEIASGIFQKIATFRRKVFYRILLARQSSPE
ncbi:MAG: class I SAM-dependent methyltransferase [Woeseiaceae bacterium]|nr:class I SAM-dependent methyltransferase [Woeseiaceae bacterium]